MWLEAMHGTIIHAQALTRALPATQEKSSGVLSFLRRHSLDSATFFVTGLSMLGLLVSGPHPAGLGGASDSTLQQRPQLDYLPAPTQLVWVEPVILHYSSVLNSTIFRPPPSWSGWSQ